MSSKSTTSRFRVESEDYTVPCDHPLCEQLHRNRRRFLWVSNTKGASWHEVKRRGWHVIDVETGERSHEVHDEYETKREAVAALAAWERQQERDAVKATDQQDTTKGDTMTTTSPSRVETLKRLSDGAHAIITTYGMQTMLNTPERLIAFGNLRGRAVSVEIRTEPTPMMFITRHEPSGNDSFSTASSPDGWVGTPLDRATTPNDFVDVVHEWLGDCEQSAAVQYWNDVHCGHCNGSRSVPATASQMFDGDDDNGLVPCPNCSEPSA